MIVVILAVDIGNTNITLGAFVDGKKIFSARLAADRDRTADQYAVEIKMISDIYKAPGLEGASVSSVVPELTPAVTRALDKLGAKRVTVLGPGVRSGLNIKTDDPAQLGADLVAAAVGALAKYEAPCFIADLGTATKISVLDANGAFLGCSIAAGVGISLRALSQNTSQLPALGADEPRQVIGTNTYTSMQSGVVLGTAAMLDGMFDRMAEEFGSQPRSIVATGGWSANIYKYCRHEVIYDPDLILDGLLRIYEKNI